jgi:Lectin C-type domain
VRIHLARTELTGRVRAPMAALALGLGMLTACGDPDPTAPPMTSLPSPVGADTQVGQSSLEPTCVEGVVEPCNEMLGEHDGIVSCYQGTRTCSGGVLGACVGGETYAVARGSASAGDAPAGNAQLGSASVTLRPLAFSAATDCTNNPCNSYCREFNEAPALGLVPDVDAAAPPLASWITGSVFDYPPEWVVVGNREPCQVAGDCQFDTACTDPSLGSCTHSVCGAGEPLVAGCNRCADSVCAIDPDCCGSALTCSHDPCEVGSGAPLDRSCDTCVDAVCAVHPECCDATWNDACVAYVADICAPLGQSCTCPGGGTEANGSCYVASDEPSDWFLARDACGTFGSGWNLLEIDDEAENGVAQSLVNTSLGSAWLGAVENSVDQWSWQSSGDLFFVSDASGGALQDGFSYQNWGFGKPQLGVSGNAIAIDTSGEWRDAPLTFELGYICEGPKNRLGPKLPPYSWSSACVDLATRACGVTCPDSAALGIGSCSPRVPTELDANCTSFDLALGATCEAAGVPQVPVCNHGQLTAPAGLRLSHLPIAQIGNATPDLSDAGDCVLTEAIPPGRCVTVTDCPGLVADRALVVNPGAIDPSECRVDDNWTIYQPLSCRPATCEANVSDARQVQLHDCGIELQNPLGIDPALARVTVGSGVPVPGCGNNEVRWGASCYFFSTDIDTWDGAQHLCRERGAGWDLVALNSDAEDAWLRSQSDPAQDIQIGLNDKDIEADHVWSNGSCREYTNWDSATSQPNNAPPGSEQCVRLTASSSGAWEDKACNDGEHPFACEGPVRDARGGCAAGQIAGPDGNCYQFERSGQSFADARSSCLALGPGWGLAVVDDKGTNDFVTSLIDCTPTWLNNPPGAFSGWKGGESVDLSNPPFMDELGYWHALPDAVDRATLCQGPATATGAPTLDQVADVTQCTADNQFYFVGNESAPETLKLCPLACAAAASVPGRHIDVQIPCAPPKPPALVTEHDEVYEPACPGSVPQWDFLYYDAITPADSRVEFEVRTAVSSDDLAANTTTFLPIAQAHAVPTDTQRCEVGPTGSGCPVDLYDALGRNGQLQQVPILQLRVRLIPGSSGEGPIVRDWKIRFSCPPAQ